MGQVPCSWILHSKKLGRSPDKQSVAKLFSLSAGAERCCQMMRCSPSVVRFRETTQHVTLIIPAAMLVEKTCADLV